MQEMNGVKKVRWGIIGTGGIARQFARGLGASMIGELYAVGSRAQETAEAFGRDFDVPRRYGSYTDLLADDAVDVVYNSLPNHLHLDWTIRAARAGKHVLCEKPLTVNAAEAERVLEVAQGANVFLMEAFMYRCHPQTLKLVDLIRDGAIGEVRVIQAAFGYDLGDGEDAYRNIRLRNDACGGSIMDVGCYTVSMARLIAGAALGLSRPAEPEVLQGVAHIGARGGVDEWSAAVARFPSGAVADLVCGARVTVQSTVRVWGSLGDIEVPVPWNPVTGKIVLTRLGKDPEEIEVPAEAGCYTLEADLVARSLPGPEAPYPCMTWEDSLNNMKALDRWRASAGLVFDAEKAQG
jgi:predicted dehydrogenase